MNKPFKFFLSSVIFGTIGLFLHFTKIEGVFVVLVRGAFGSLFILLVMFLKKKKFNLFEIKKNIKILALSGISLGSNWIFLFEGYKYAVSITSLCNYTAPIMILVISAILYKEKINAQQFICILLSFIGIVLVSGLFVEGASNDPRAFIFGLIAALGFVMLVLCNRKLAGIEPLQKSVVQLVFSTITVLPYIIFANEIPQSFSVQDILVLISMGIIHTGLAYMLYFDSVDTLPVIQVVILGYIEPVLMFLTGAIILHEEVTIYSILGAILILGSALYNEIFSSKIKKN